MKLSEILRAGKQRIETEGWAHDAEAAYYNKGCCAATAITSQKLDWDNTVAAVEFIKGANGLDPDRGIGEWNDAPERTVAEVLAAYDKAITAAEAQEQAK